MHEYVKKFKLTTFFLSFLVSTSSYGADNGNRIADELLESSKPKSDYSSFSNVVFSDKDGDSNCSGPKKANISYSGGAFRFPYHFGNAAYLQQKYKIVEALQGKTLHLYGASAGALTTTLLASDTDIATDMMGVAEITANGPFKYKAGGGWLDGVYGKLEKKSTGVYFNIINAIREYSMEKPLLKDCCWENASGNVTFSLTSLQGFPHNERVSKFTSKQNLIDYALASCHIPWLVDGNFSDTTIPGKSYIDGGITDNQPVSLCPGEETIKIYPYMGTIWSWTPLSWGSLYGTTSMERNRRMFEDGYRYAEEQDKKGDLWKPLSPYVKKK